MFHRLRVTCYDNNQVIPVIFKGFGQFSQAFTAIRIAMVILGNAVSLINKEDTSFGLLNDFLNLESSLPLIPGD